MAMYMDCSGLTDVEKMLNKLGEKAQGIAALGLYEGAGVMADEIKKGASEIRASKFHYAVFPAYTRDPSPEEKAIVEQADAGIAKFRKNGSEVDTSVGYRNAGYAVLAGKTKPIPAIVNAINSGTSFMKKQPFFRKAVNRGTSKAQAAIVAKIEAEVEALAK